MSTPKQMACIWQHFLYKHNQNKKLAREELLKYFSVAHIRDIPKEQSWKYIGNEIRLEHRSSIGFSEMKALERDWNIKEEEEENGGKE